MNIAQFKTILHQYTYRVSLSDLRIITENSSYGLYMRYRGFYKRAINWVIWL